MLYEFSKDPQSNYTNSEKFYSTALLKTNEYFPVVRNKWRGSDTHGRSMWFADELLVKQF